ncbi:MAG TPA: nucleotide kinase domain-containing protein, partial [Candidatus Saccharimonadales bacterium]|nr:nucleotide kinase domain-containing protein [Candidatus Saccharimonadales bacterium]
YWQFAAKRQAIFEKRLIGAPRPWTDDPILQTYKFCNVYRATDRVSQYMIREVCYGLQNDTPADRLFQIVAFRTFSRPETWEGIQKFLGHSPTLQDLADDSLTKALEYVKQTDGKLYTHAFILCAADSYRQGAKYLNHVELFRHMFLSEDLTDKLLAAKSLKEVYELLHTFPLMGDFMSYQTAIDLNYSDLINFSENDFTKAGPGALRGMKKVFSDFGGLTPEQIIMWMVEHQDVEFKRLGLKFNGLFGRPLHAIDAQGLFCETDKYCREAIPDITSARSKIKSKFTATPEPIKLFFPPKWHIKN